MVFPVQGSKNKEIAFDVGTVIGTSPFKVRFDLDSSDTVRSYYKPKGVSIISGDRIVVLSVEKNKIILGAFEEVK